MRLASLICAAALAAAAQTTDGIYVSVSRSVNIPSDQAEFVGVVGGSLDLTQQQVAQAFRDLGVANPTVINTAVAVPTYAYPPPADTQFFYQVSFLTAPEAIKDLARKLDAFRAALPQGVTSFQYAAGLTASAAAVESARKTVLPLLMADARVKAQSLAEIAGLKVGSVLSVSDNSIGYGYVAPASYILGNFLASGSFSSSYSGSGTQYTFAVSIRFATQ